jgi:hypothetical protein
MEHPLCFGTDEFSPVCTICKNCRAKTECSDVNPKKEVRRSKRKQKVQDNDELGNV